MSVLITKNFISKADAVRFCEFFDKHSRPTQREEIINALGYNDSLEASTIDGTTGVIIGNQEETNFELGRLFQAIKEKAQRFFHVELDLCQSNYQLMLPGGSNPLHADSINLDGTPIQPDGTPEEIEWSGLLYLNTYGEDFTGGEITFPEFDLTIRPELGDLVLFRGDIPHRHGVSVVESGERKNIVFFWAKKGNVSSGRVFFEY
jgi:hypothetical protein